MNTSYLASNWNTVHKHRIHKQLLTITQPNWREIKLHIERISIMLQGFRFYFYYAYENKIKYLPYIC